MKASEVREALGPVLAVLRELGVGHYVGGSVASSVHGVARTTLDIDVIADLKPEHAHAVFDALRGDFYVDDEAVREAVERRSSFNAIHLATMIKIDVFVPKGHALDRLAMERAEDADLDAEGGGFVAPVSSREDVVLAKLVWYRDGGEVSERQWGDALGVLRLNRGAMEREYLQRGSVALGVEALLSRALREAGWDE